MELNVDSSRQMRSNLQFNNIYGVCHGGGYVATWMYPLSRGRFWPIWQNLANDSCQMRQNGVILSITLCRRDQGEQMLNTDFWISFRGWSYTPANLVYFFKVENCTIWPSLACHSSESSNTSLEPPRRAEENAVNRTSLPLSKPDISGFQFCIRYTLKPSIYITPIGPTILAKYNKLG